MTMHKILIADDEPKLLRAIETRLKHEGYRVITSQDAYQALALARHELPELLLLDVNMPAGDGFSVQDRIESIKELKDVPVIYMTGESPGAIDQKAQDHGAFGIVHKPFETAELLNMIQDALGLWAGELNS